MQTNSITINIPGEVLDPLELSWNRINTQLADSIERVTSLWQSVIGQLNALHVPDASESCIVVLRPHNVVEAAGILQYSQIMPLQTASGAIAAMPRDFVVLTLIAVSGYELAFQACGFIRSVDALSGCKTKLNSWFNALNSKAFLGINNWGTYLQKTLQVLAVGTLAYLLCNVMTWIVFPPWGACYPSGGFEKFKYFALVGIFAFVVDVTGKAICRKLFPARAS